MPFNASTAGVQRAAQGAVSVTSSQGAAFGANFQPPQQMQPPMHMHPNNVQPPATFTANMAMVKRPVAFTAIVSSVTTSQGAASEVDKRNNLYKAAIRALGLDEFDSESDDEHTLPASPGFGYVGNSGAGNLQEINVAGDNVEDFSDIRDIA